MINIDEEVFRIGVITEPHGIKGEVKVFPTTDEPGRMGKIKEMYLSLKGGYEPVHPVQARAQNNLMIMRFQEFQDRNDVEKLRKVELYIKRSDAVRLKKDEYYITDLIGLKVINDKDEEFATLTEVFQTGANDVYELTYNDGSVHLVPAIKQCILEVNVPDGYIKINVMEGL